MPATIPALQEGRYTIEQEFPYVENTFLFQAYDTRDETPVTIVEVPVRLPKVANAAQREAMSSSFGEQAKALIGFKHKSVVAVHSYFTEAGRNYLVTDRVDGVGLASVLADQKEPFNVEQTAGWADTVLDALNVLHNSRPARVYRNLRPENMILRADGNVDLVAAGMICDGTGNAGSSPLGYSPLEQIWSGLDAASQKVIINKYDEASERILKQDLDARSDLYSLGATLYHLVTGQAPVDSLERSIEMIEGNADPLRSPNKVNPSIPVEVSDVIMKAMEIKREYRFDSAAIMRQVMKTALVRVKERESEEALVQKVEQHDVRPAVQNAPAPTAEKVVQENAAARKRREAEERLLEAARRAEEAERKIESTEAVPSERITDSFNLAELEDDVLGLLSPSAHTSEPPQVKSAPHVDHPPVVEPKSAKPSDIPSDPPTPVEKPAPVVEKKHETFVPSAAAQQETAETVPVVQHESDHIEPVGLEAEPEAEPVKQLHPEPVKEVAETVQPAHAAAAPAFSLAGDDELFTERKTGSGLGLPAMAAAAVVLCIAAIGGWFYFGSKPAPAAATEIPAASQPAQQEPPSQNAFQQTDPPVTETTAVPAADQPAIDQPSTGQFASQEQPEKVASAAQPRAKKPAPAPSKAPAQKKAVTVDDLINDN